MLTRELKAEIEEKIKSGITHQLVFNELENQVDDKQELARVIKLIPSKQSFEKAKPLQSIVFVMLMLYISFGYYTIQFFNAPVLSDKHYFLKYLLYVIAMVTAVLVYRFKNQRIKFLTIFIPVLYMNFLNQIIAPQFTKFTVANVALFFSLTIAQGFYMHWLTKDNFIDAEG
jgi:hypothetical protein